MPARVAASLLTVLLIAGCGSPPSGEETTEPQPKEGDRRALTPVGGFNATDCKGLTFVTYLPREAVAPELPEGYQPVLLPGTAVGVDEGSANLWLRALACANLDLDGTIEQDVRIATAGVWVVQGGSYRWEIFVDEPAPAAVLGLLQAQGWPAKAARISIGDLGFEVEAEGIRYAVPMTNPAQDHEKFEATSTRAHFVEADGTHHVMGEDFASGTQMLHGAVLQPEGGVFSRISARLGGAPLPGSVQDDHSDLGVRLYNETSPA